MKREAHFRTNHEQHTLQLVLEFVSVRNSSDHTFMQSIIIDLVHITKSLQKPCTVRLFCLINSHPYHLCIYACIVTGYVETAAYYNDFFFVSWGCVKFQESLFHSSMTSDCAYTRGSRVLLLTVTSDKMLASSCKCQAKLKSGRVG